MGKNRNEKKPKSAFNKDGGKKIPAYMRAQQQQAPQNPNDRIGLNPHR